MATLNNFFSVANMIVPSEGPKVVPVIFDFTGIDSIEVDGSQMVQQGQMKYVQTVYIDNSDNGDPVSIISDVTDQRITCPANSQGNFNLFMPNNPRFTVETTGAVILTIFFCNFPLIPAVWSAVDTGGVAAHVIVDSGTLDEVTLVGAVTEITDPVTIAETPSALHYVETTLALTGGDDIIVAAAAGEYGGTIVNPVGNNTVTVNMAGASALVSGIPLNAGGSIVFDGCTNAIHIAGTAAQSVYAFTRAV